METSATGRAVGGGADKADDGFAGFGVFVFFAGEAFDGGGVVLDGVNRRLQTPRGFLLLPDLGVQGGDLAAQLFVLPDERQIFDNGQFHDGDQSEDNDHPGQLAPNAQVPLSSLPVKPQPARMESR